MPCSEDGIESSAKTAVRAGGLNTKESSAQHKVVAEC